MDSEGGYVSDFYIRGNASFINHYSAPATAVLIQIHYRGAYGDHDAYIIKRGNFAPGVQIDPKRRAWVAMLQPEALNIDLDGAREIDIWNTIGATCSVVGVDFADGTNWTSLKANDQSPFTGVTPAPMPTKKCAYNAKTKAYECQ